MNFESLLVFALVAASFIYALWHLLPQTVVRVLSKALQRLPLPGRVSAYFEAAAHQQSGCHCSGCEHLSNKRPVSAAAGAPRITRFHGRKN